jgi:acetylglutamate kinase
LTDIETVEIAEMVLAGSINKEIVQLINQHGGRAVGLCGKDAGLIQAKKHYPQVEDADGKITRLDIGYVGEIVRVDPELLRSLKAADYIPVIAPNGVGDDGNTYNINADTVAGEVAATLEAEKLILLTDTRGILLDPSDETTLIPTLNTNQIDSYIQNGVIGAGMLPKVEACTTALAASVSKTHIIDGRLKHAMLLEIFTSHGIGTEIVKT